MMMNERLQYELLEMAAVDQAAFDDLEEAIGGSAELQAKVTARSEPGFSTPAWPVEWMDDPPVAIARVQAVVERNTRQMKEIIREVGWPGRSLVGNEGAAAAWLLVHHTADLTFQRACLALLSGAVDQGEADPLQLEWLTDRVLLREGKPEEFGTHEGRRGDPPVPSLPPRAQTGKRSEGQP